MVISAKTAEMIEMPFAIGVADLDGPKESCVRWGPDPHQKGQFSGKGLPTVKYRDLLT